MISFAAALGLQSLISSMDSKAPSKKEGIFHSNMDAFKICFFFLKLKKVLLKRTRRLKLYSINLQHKTFSSNLTSELNLELDPRSSWKSDLSTTQLVRQILSKTQQIHIYAERSSLD